MPLLLRYCARIVFPRYALPCVTSFALRALPRFITTIRLSDSLHFICLLRFPLIRHTPFHGRKYRASRVTVCSQFKACHGLRPREDRHTLAYSCVPVLTSASIIASSLPVRENFRGSVPSTLRLTACLLAVLRLNISVTESAPRTRYHAVGYTLHGREFHPIEHTTLLGRTILFFHSTGYLLKNDFLD